LAGTLTTNLPSGTTIANDIFDVYLITTASAVKEIDLTYWDFWQGN
jgi:hypothetical protein